MDITNLGVSLASGDVLGTVLDGASLIYDAAATAVPGLPGGAGAIRTAVRSAEVASKAITAAAKYEAHHALPKFLGGAADQITVKLEKTLHTKFHQELRTAMSEAGMSLRSPKNGGIGISKIQISDYFKRNPGSQDKAVDVLMETAQKFDKENGTNLTQAILDAIRDGKMNRYGEE